MSLESDMAGVSQLVSTGVEQNHVSSGKSCLVIKCAPRCPFRSHHRTDVTEAEWEGHRDGSCALHTIMEAEAWSLQKLANC